MIKINVRTIDPMIFPEDGELQIIDWKSDGTNVTVFTRLVAGTSDDRFVRTKQTVIPIADFNSLGTPSLANPLQPTINNANLGAYLSTVHNLEFR